jgi:hypothetical protein
MPATQRRTVRDFINDAFFARDKASLAAIVKDAEEAIPPELLQQEPDGDEGDEKHNSAVHVHIKHGGDASVEDRIGKLEGGLKAIDTKLSLMCDAIAKATKDGELPPWLQGGAEGEGGDPAAAEGGDPPKDPPTEDMDVPDGEEGKLSMEKLAAAEPELMDADGSKKTGEMKMGDAAVVKGLARLIKDVRARGEILVPGFKMPTIDAKPGLKTADALCGARRAVLDAAAKTADGKAILGRWTPETIKRMSCDGVRALFLDASDRMKARNNTKDNFVAGDDVFIARDEQTARLKKINAANHDFWSKQTGAPRH